MTSINSQSNDTGKPGLSQVHRLPTVNAEDEEDIFALSKSSFNPGQSSVWQPGQSAANDSLAFTASGIKNSDDMLQRADSNSDSLAFSASGVSGRSFFNRSRSSAMSKTGGTKSQRKSSLKQRSSSFKSSGGTSMKRKGRKPGEQIVDFQLTTESFARSSLNHRADTQSFLQSSIVDTKKTNSSIILDDRIMNADQFVDFALTQKSVVDISVKVDGQLESLRSVLDLLRMRLSIQEDFTLGGIVAYFDPMKKGYITAEDLKKADALHSLDHLDD